MARKIARAFISLFGIMAGIGIIELISQALRTANIVDINVVLLPITTWIIYIAVGLIGGFVFFLLSPAIINNCIKFSRFIESKLAEMPIADILFGTLGLIVALVIAFLLSNLIAMIPIDWINITLSTLLYLFLAYLGWTIGVRRRSELSGWVRRGPKEGVREHRKHGAVSSRPKILDTSVIIDGRIFDICETGIIEGTIIIPGFVLQELRHIADSSDALKRNRGRRGLDVLGRIQKELDIPVQVLEKDYPDVSEVDVKLLKLAVDMGGVVVTNDYNLNKVAEVQDVNVFNINELANSLRPVVLPGEEMRVTVVKDGKEPGQGVGYLDDGTMIVVDSARHMIGETVDVLVTSVLQTAAGRMIFAKLKNAERAV